MTLGDFLDVLGRLHKLTPAQRLAVAEVLAEPVASETVEATTNRKPYGRDEVDDFTDASNDWEYKTPAQKIATVRLLAKRFGRTEKAIRYQITSRL